MALKQLHATSLKINMNSKNGFKMQFKNLTIQNDLVDTD